MGLSFLMVFFSGWAAAEPTVPKTIPVGALVSLTGYDSNLGGQAKAGYELGAEEINRSGGVYVKEYGRKIPLEVIVQDMESDMMKVPVRMEWLHSTKKVVTYVGTTMMATAGTGIAEKNRIPTLAIASPRQIHHDRGLKYWFSPMPKTLDVAKIILDFFDTLPTEKRPKTVAIFQEQQDFGIEQAEYFRKELRTRDYRIVADEKYSPLSKDLSPMILSAKNAGAELVLSNPITPDAMLMMRQMKEIDYNPKAIVVLRGAEDLSWGKALGPIGSHVVIMGGWHHLLRFPGVDGLNASHQAKYGRPADIQTGPAYASMQILAAAIERAGALDTAKIRDSMAATDMMTVVGRAKFRPNGTLIDPVPAVVQWQGGGQKLIWPKESADGSLVCPIPAWKDR